MEVDAATRWVSPFFVSVPGQDGRPGMVRILNVGPGPAKVSVAFYELEGMRQADKECRARNRREFLGERHIRRLAAGGMSDRGPTMPGVRRRRRSSVRFGTGKVLERFPS